VFGWFGWLVGWLVFSPVAIAAQTCKGRGHAGSSMCSLCVEAGKEKGNAKEGLVGGGGHGVLEVGGGGHGTHQHGQGMFGVWVWGQL
jgi:hypothetical protein